MLFKKRNISVPSKPGENQGQRLGEFESRSVKTRDTVRLNKEKDNIQSEYMYMCAYFNFFHETVNSHNLEKPTTSFSWFIAL